MKYLNLIPACHNYLKNHPKRISILLALAEQGCKDRYPDITVTQEQLLSLFQSAGITDNSTLITESAQLSSMDCFTIVSEYKCSFICQICPLCARYKNAKEAEESALLSYALSNPQNFNLLKTSGVESSLFQALFLVNPNPSGTLVATLPLNRLVYFYLECTASTLTSFSSLPSDITIAIERDNAKKLTKEHVKSILTYLKIIQKGYRGRSEESIAAILRDCYQLDLKLDLLKEPAHKPYSSEEKQILCSAEPLKQDSVQSEKELVVPLNPAITDHKIEAASCKAPQPMEGDCLEGLLTSSVPTLPLVVSLPVNKTPALFINKAESLPPSLDTRVSATPAKQLLFLPSQFPADEYGGYPVLRIDSGHASDREVFQTFLLNHPKLALEVVTDAKTGAECLLFYGSEAFYLLSTKPSEATDLLRQFLSKSSVRNQICLDPYRLYYFFVKNKMPYQGVFSLRAAYTAMAKTQKRAPFKSIDGMVLELVSRSNVYELPAHIFLCPHYLNMYNVITRNHSFQLHEAQQRFENISCINTLLGISYDLQETVNVPVDVHLFEIDEHFKYNFHYNKESMTMKSGIYSVTYTITSSHPDNSIAMEVLFYFARNELLTKFSYRLLIFHQDSFTIATKEKDYAHLCELVVNVATHIATQKEVLPIYVTEERIPK